MRKVLAFACVVLALTPALATGETIELGTPVVMRGAAVAETPAGFVGATATFTITIAKNGSGHIFLDTFPLTQVDMQGSARLAARVASQVTGHPLSTRDVFFVIRSGSTQIGGPSAGATLAVGAIAALQEWQVRPDVMMTGTIQPDGSVGPVGGIPEKAQAAADIGIRRFLFPAGEEQAPLSSQPGVTVDIIAHCRDVIGIVCVPVRDVYEAVENMTDHAFVRTPVVGNVTGDSFRAKLGPLSAELVANAQRLLDEAVAESGDVPASASRRVIEEEIASARASLERARNASANGTHYTAASLSFQSSIASHDARDRSRVAKAPDAPAAVARVLAADREAVERARGEIASRRVEDSSTFESLGASQVRLLEAETRLRVGEELAKNGTDPSRAIYEGAYAAQRAETARWWLKLGEGAPAGAAVSEAALEDAALDTITTTSEQIAYVEAVFGVTNSGPALALSRTRLAEAQAAMTRGFYAAAMLSSMEAQVRSSNVLLLGGFGRVPEERLEQARVEAARAIQEARGRGAEPLLAESEYEFGLSLEDPMERLAFLGLARLTANLAGLPDIFGTGHTGTPSRFQGFAPDIGAPHTYIAAAFAVGLALGVGMGLTAMMPSQRKAFRER